MVTEYWPVVLAGAALVVGSALGRPVTGESRYPVEARDTVRRSVPLVAGGERRVEISNLSGAVVVTAAPVSAIEVVAERTMQAVDARAMAEAGRISALITTETAQGVTIRASGELAGACDERRERQWDGERPYRVESRVEIRVPANVAVRLCDVNGSATVTGVLGGVHVTTVNGAIDVSGVNGPVTLKTVNGGITADTRSRPDRPWSMQTVNGQVRLMLPADASADLRMKTMHGGLYTDFATTALPADADGTTAPVAPVVEQRGGRRLYRANRGLGIRIGKGGPVVTLETVNGDIRVQQRPGERGARPE